MQLYPMYILCKIQKTISHLVHVSKMFVQSIHIIIAQRLLTFLAFHYNIFMVWLNGFTLVFGDEWLGIMTYIYRPLSPGFK